VAEVITDDIVSAAQAGDAAALRAIYDDLAPVVLGYLRAKGVADPEAAASDVFLAVLPRLPELTGGAAGLRSFAFSIAHARIVDDARRRRRRPVPVQYRPETDARVTDSAEHEALGRLATTEVVELLGQLPGVQREVVLLRVVADLSVDEVAQIVHRSPGAVKQLQRRALLTLRQILDQRGGVTRR
jgi:RNA polymerase sigma factor (sigma-70 family)